MFKVGPDVQKLNFSGGWLLHPAVRYDIVLQGIKPTGDLKAELGATSCYKKETKTLRESNVYMLTYSRRMKEIRQKGI